MIGRAQTLVGLVVLLVGFSAGWLVNGWRAESRISRAETYQAKQAESQATQAKDAIEKKAGAVISHGSAQQENTHDYTKKMVVLEAGRAADAARIAGLQHDIRAAATRNAQLAGDAAACRDLADQHQRLAALAGEGAGVVGELVGLVERRDAQVNALKGQISIERKLINEDWPR